MGTYFHGGSEFHGDGLQTLLLMNPNYVGYSNTQHHQQQPPQANNFVFLNSAPSAAAAHALNQPDSPHAPPNSSQHLVGVPLHAHGSASTHDHRFFRPVHYSMQTSIDPAATREATPHRHTLSLSLSSRQTNPGIASPLASRGEVQVSSGSASMVSRISNDVNVLVGSKYLRAAQELLKEVLNIGNVEKDEFVKSAREASVAVGGLCGGETSGKRGGELTSTERQEAQMKKAKLVNMLDEVEQRYRQYHNQMQNVISWFEQSTGIGSARTYTALALQKISKQFRYLKDAITNQIRAASNTLGEEQEGCRNEGSGLKFVDHQLKQQRAMQQLGMVQPNTWRPQRGLPERAVSVLRAWLFEHFLHPYPKDSDKVMLAKQTGLSRSQVSNWFINARVRLWKPMVEEMYMEETKEQEQSKAEDKSTKSTENKSKTIPHSNPISPENTIPTPSPAQNNPTFSRIDITQGSPKKQRTSETLQSLIGAPEDFTGGFGSYSIGEITRFGGEHFSTGYSANGVSLTLGLPHCESLSMQGRHQGGVVLEQSIELGRSVENCEGNEFVASNSQSRDVFEGINLQDRNRFSTQLVRDYVV